MSINTEEFLRFKAGLLRNNLANIIHVDHSESPVTVIPNITMLRILVNFLTNIKLN